MLQLYFTLIGSVSCMFTAALRGGMRRGASNLLRTRASSMRAPTMRAPAMARHYSSSGGKDDDGDDYESITFEFGSTNSIVFFFQK